MALEKPHHFWFRFRMRTLLIVLTIFAFPLGWVGSRLNQARREQKVSTWVSEMGGNWDVNPRLEGQDIPITDKWFGERVYYVKFHNSQVTDLSSLAELENLNILILYNIPAKDLSPLAKLKNLKTLYLNTVPISDLSPLQEIKNLRNLELHNIEVSDLSPLAELKNLKSLLLDSVPISDLMPLVELDNLKSLQLRNTLVSEEQVEMLMHALSGSLYVNNIHP